MSIIEQALGAGRAWRGLPADAPTSSAHTLRARWSAAFALEVEERRLFLWVPVCAGAGAIIQLTAVQDASWLFALMACGFFSAMAYVTRLRALVCRLAIVCAAICGGIASGGLRTDLMAAPIIERPMVVEVKGYLEEVDHRHQGARFIVRVSSVEGLERDKTPFRIRLTTKRDMDHEAGAAVSLRARLVPPAHASLPGGYDFARDAYFARLGAVGSLVGSVEPTSLDMPADFVLRFYARVDRIRNALAKRVEATIGGPAGAIGAAMVTGKRDYLDDPTREVIREAGIFHIITIAGVQMTLVAGIFFLGLRRLLALSRTLALHYPIKKWAASLAILAAIAYDILTGSRVGTDRALYMTVIMLGAVLCDREAFSMRNLALAAFVVVLVEPEAFLGASFQLSFAAVAGLIAIWELRSAASNRAFALKSAPQKARVDYNDKLLLALDRARHGPVSLLLSTICATACTLSFMSYNFHELSPYVLIGNPLTLAMIEFFAVPAALLGSFLYPLGLDRWIWAYLGLGIELVMWVARWIADLPGATIHLKAFAPWTLNFLALAVLCAVLWRSWWMKALSLPLLALGVWGINLGDPFDVVIAPQGDVVGFRSSDGALMVMGQRPNSFAIEQWLRADGDGRPAAKVAILTPRKARDGMPARCDAQGCVAELSDGRRLALVLDERAFAEDCARADVIVSPLYAPTGCSAELVLDGGRLRETGAVTFRTGSPDLSLRMDRATGENRPWSRAPRSQPRNANGAPRGRALQDWQDEEGDGPEAPPFR